MFLSRVLHDGTYQETQTKAETTTSHCQIVTTANYCHDIVNTDLYLNYHLAVQVHVKFTSTLHALSRKSHVSATYALPNV